MANGSEAAASTTSIPDINEAGRVMAELNDWRAIVFVLVFVITMLLIERLWAQREMRLERREMRDLAKSFSDSATKVADALSTLRLEVGVLRVVAARMESVSGLEYLKASPSEEKGND